MNVTVAKRQTLNNVSIRKSLQTLSFTEILSQQIRSVAISAQHARRGPATFRSAFFLYAMFQRDPRAGAFLGGDRVSGQDVRDQNGEQRTGDGRL